jgi:hypothetical protein
MAKYARGTSVSITQSKADIQSVLARFNCIFDGIHEEPGRAICLFHGHNRSVRFVLWLPMGLPDQQQRELWRALHLGIKGKLVCVASRIESFEQAFWAHIVTETGETVYESKTKPQLRQLVRGN